MTIFERMKLDVAATQPKRARIAIPVLKQELQRFQEHVVRGLQGSSPEIRQEQIRYLHSFSSQLVRYQEKLPEIVAREEALRKSNLKPCGETAPTSKTPRSRSSAVTRRA